MAPIASFSSGGNEALPRELDRRLARVRDLFERIDFDSRDEKAVALLEGRTERAC